jgi:hypothetical protein
VNGPDLWLLGACVIECVESRPKRQVVALLYGRFSPLRRHIPDASIRYSDPLAGIEKCYLCCRGKA